MISTILRNARLRARLILGLVLILHGLAHLSAVINATNRIIAAHNLSTAERAHSHLWAVSLLSALAVSALLAGGLGALHVRVFASRWRAFTLSGLSTSIILLALYPAAGNLPGLLISLGLFTLLYRRAWLAGAQAGTTRKPAWIGRATALTWLLLISFTAAALAFRPVWLRWGAQPGESTSSCQAISSLPVRGFRFCMPSTSMQCPTRSGRGWRKSDTTGPASTAMPGWRICSGCRS